MKKLFAVLLVAASSFSFAADEFNTIYVCHSTPFIADGGYVVTVESGGFAGLTQVVLERNTFSGREHVDTYIVRPTILPGRKLYVGRDFTLEIGPKERPRTIGIPSPIYRGSFRAVIGGDAVMAANVTCRSPRDPQ